MIKPFGKAEDLPVVLGTGANNELGTLSCGRKGRRMGKTLLLLGALADPGGQMTHGQQDGIGIFLRSQQAKALASGKLDIDTHTVGQLSGPIEEFLRSTGNSLQMNVAARNPTGAAVSAPKSSAPWYDREKHGPPSLKTILRYNYADKRPT